MMKILWSVLILFSLLWFNISFLVSAERVVSSATAKPTQATHSSTGDQTDFLEPNNSTYNTSDFDHLKGAAVHSGSAEQLEGVLEPSIVNDEQVLESENFNDYKSQAFVEIASQNAGVANNIATGGQPVIVTLSDSATEELQNRANKQQIDPALSNNKSDEILTNSTSLPSLRENETAIRSETNQTQNGTESEDIPSFSEWAQKHLEEAEKKEQVNSSSKPQSTTNKLRSKNYASLDCGAKVIAANPESQNAGAILSPSRDEYKLNACTNRIWFIVELCESIQAKKIDLANYELFSSSPKDFTVSVSDRFPSRDWSTVGQFTAKDEKDIQSFDLDQQIFGKYIKVEIKSHYGAEHYCPISLFRVYGTSVFEVLQKEDPAHVNRVEEEEDDDDDETVDADSDDTPKNLFSSATDAVISMVKKAAQVLGNKSNDTNGTSQEKMQQFVHFVQVCNTPSHLVVCDNCSDALFAHVYELLSCKALEIDNLVNVPFIRRAVIHSNICRQFGFDLKRKNGTESIKSCPDCIKSFFPLKYLGAMCNFVAIAENKVVLNVSRNFTAEEESEVVLLNESIKGETILEGNLPDEGVVLENIESKSSCSTDTSQIKPTKPLTSDMELTPTEISSENGTQSRVLSTETVIEPPTEKSLEQNTDTVEHSGEIYQEIETVTENLDEHLDNFIQELSGENSTPNPTTTNIQPQKESVFLRLSNRIKALERNMSLSGQYLEELSKRYKKQVEEMQRLLEKTITTFREEDQKKEERTKRLEEQVERLIETVDRLVAEKSSVWSVFGWFVFLICAGGAFVVYLKRRERPQNRNAVEIQRRKSIDVISHEPKTKRRRPSDQALKIVRASLCEEAAKGVKEKRKKKRKSLARSNSINTLSEQNDWISDSVQVLEDTPYVLEESEHSTLEPMFPELEQTVDIPKGNGKIDVPDFVQTATTVRMNRTSSSHNGSVGQLRVEVPQRKAVSVDESVKKHRKSPSLSTSTTTNGNDSISSGVNEYETPKKERKGFKKLLKKVF